MLYHKLVVWYKVNKFIKKFNLKPKEEHDLCSLPTLVTKCLCLMNIPGVHYSLVSDSIKSKLGTEDWQGEIYYKINKNHLFPEEETTQGLPPEYSVI